MKGIIMNFRRARHHAYERQMVIDAGADKEKAVSLIGKEVIWKSTAGKAINGKITALHGSKGTLRALFETGMPGQAVGTEVEILA